MKLVVKTDCFITSGNLKKNVLTRCTRIIINNRTLNYTCVGYLITKSLLKCSRNKNKNVLRIDYNMLRGSTFFFFPALKPISMKC